MAKKFYRVTLIRDEQTLILERPTWAEADEAAKEILGPIVYRTEMFSDGTSEEMAYYPSGWKSCWIEPVYQSEAPDTRELWSPVADRY